MPVGKAPYRSADATVSGHRFAAITPSDTVDIEVTRGVYVGVTGNVVLIGAENADAETVTMVAAAVGEHPWQVRRILASGTTAANLIAIY